MYAHVRARAQVEELQSKKSVNISFLGSGQTIDFTDVLLSYLEVYMVTSPNVRKFVPATELILVKLHGFCQMRCF